MQRRHFLRASATTAAWAGLPGHGWAATPTLRSAARDAWLYGLPLIEMAGARAKALRAAPPNSVAVSRALITLDTQLVTTPNNDTLYARAWIDLGKGPVTITLPPTGARYFSVALMDMYTNNFAVLGTRATGNEGGTFTLVGPGDAATGPLPLRSPTRWVWLLARTLVDGPADVAAANAVQAGLTVEGPAAEVPRDEAGRGAPWSDYFRSVQTLLDENPPPVTDLATVRSFAPLGLGVRARFDPTRFKPAEVAEIEAGIVDAVQLLRTTRPTRPIEGWMYAKANLGNFGDDHLYRAQIAVGGLAALPPNEAMYMRAVNPTGGPLFDSADAHRLLFPAGALPPVNAFWSLTLYETTADGQLFLTPNAIGRFAIGDRTPGLVRGADGSLEIWMTRNDPGEARRANWLPTPQGKPFCVILRAYLPKTELVNGSYRLPPVRVVPG